MTEVRNQQIDPAAPAGDSAAGPGTGTDFAVDPGALRALRTRLAGRAEEGGLIDIAYRTVDSPVGPLLLAATDAGLVRVAFACEDFGVVLGSLASAFGPRILEAPARLDDAARELDEYFAGTREAFDLVLDHGLSAGFRRTVQEYLPRIGYGHTLTYQQVAAAVGNPKAVRAVGTACATNPLPVVVPCHRVLRSDGRIGGYLGGPEAKAALLEFEQAG